MIEDEELEREIRVIKNQIKSALKTSEYYRNLVWSLRMELLRLIDMRPPESLVRMDDAAKEPDG